MFRTVLLIALTFAGSLVVPCIAQENRIADEGRIDRSSKTPASEKVTVGVVIAENVLLHNGKIRTWDELLDDLRRLRKERSKPLALKFRVTRGALETLRKERLEKDIAKIDPAIVESSDVQVGTMSAASSVRYDAIETEADLVPKPEQIRRGSVRTTTGRPVRNGIVLLIPKERGRMPPLPTPEWIKENELDETWSRLDREGNFEIAAPSANYWLAVIAPMGFAFGPLPESGKSVELTLEPAATLEVASTNQVAQQVALVINPKDSPEHFMGFGMFTVEIGKKPLSTQIPAGTVTVYQIRERMEGGAELVQANQLSLMAGGREAIVLHPLEQKPEPE